MSSTDMISPLTLVGQKCLSDASFIVYNCSIHIHLLMLMNAYVILNSFAWLPRDDGISFELREV